MENNTRRVTRLSSQTPIGAINSYTSGTSNNSSPVIPACKAYMANSDQTKDIPLLEAISATNMEESLKKINLSLEALNKSVDLLQTSHTDLRKDLTTIRSEIGTIGSEAKATKVSFDLKIENLDAKITTKQEANHSELTNLLRAQGESIAEDIAAINLNAEIQGEKVTSIQLLTTSQTEKIELLEKLLGERSEEMARMEERLEEHIQRTNDRFMRAQDDVEANRILINDVEQHGRRWALRVVGLKAPIEKPEKSDVSKDLVIQFLSTHLKINNIRPSDLDCAHRIGPVKDGKQAILIRFFRRNIVEDLMRQKKY